MNKKNLIEIGFWKILVSYNIIWVIMSYILKIKESIVAILKVNV